jgi:hypothetical protein
VLSAVFSRNLCPFIAILILDKDANLIIKLA